MLWSLDDACPENSEKAGKLAEKISFLRTQMMILTG